MCASVLDLWRLDRGLHLTDWACLKNRWKGKARNKAGEEAGLDRGRNQKALMGTRADLHFTRALRLKGA